MAELAALAGCHAFALTDHDCLDGVVAARERATELGVAFVAGCELSCRARAGAVHLLAYWVDPGEGELEATLTALRRGRDERNRLMVEHLAGLGLPITLAEVEERSGGGATGRPHMAAILVERGVVGSVQEAFDAWLGRGRPGHVDYPMARLSPAQALGLVARSGAVAVLAHPLSLGLEGEALGSAVAELAGLGLSGLEAVYGRYSPAQRASLSDLARTHGLVATGGSDHHGAYKPDLSIGVGRGDLAVPDAVLDELAARRA